MEKPLPRVLVILLADYLFSKWDVHPKEARLMARKILEYLDDNGWSLSN